MPQASRIAVFDDYAPNRERWSSMITQFGGNPFRVEAPPTFLHQVPAFLSAEHITQVVCDHRLYERPYADYNGAQLAALCFEHGVGAVLVTNFGPEDADLVIRPFRSRIPVLVATNEMKIPVIKGALEQADQEVRLGITPATRKPYRSILTVRQLVRSRNRVLVKVLLGQWRANEEVGLPLDMIPDTMHGHVLPGQLLLAQVNIGAESSADLFFTDFELPDPDALRKSQAFFDNP